MQPEIKTLIVYEDQHIIVCHKPAGISVQSARIGAADLVSLLKNQKEIIQNKKKELELIERKINNRIKQIEDASSWKLDEISIKKFPERKAIVLKSDIPVNDDLEYSIRKLERNHNLSSSVFLGKIGVRLSAENIKNMSYNSFSSIFMLIEDEDLCQSPASIINKGEYIFIRFAEHMLTLRHITKDLWNI